MANEKRLIDANDLQKRLEETMIRFPFDKGKMFSLIEQSKTEDAVEVVHGRWKYYHKQNIAVCTNCSFERNLDENFGKAVSCPNCGADMRSNKDG